MFAAHSIAVIALLGGMFQQPTPLPANYIRVDAPAAARLIAEEKAKHSEIKKLGLHAVPPSATDNVIIASDTLSKVGKKSSPGDLEKLAQHKDLAVRIEKEGIYDLLLPITDEHGGDLDGGFVVMEVPFDKAASEADALKIGAQIRNEIQSQIKSKDALYQP